MTKCLTFLNYHGGARYTQLVGGELASYRAFLFFLKQLGVMFVVAGANPWPPALSAFSVRKALLNVRLFSLQKEKLIIFLTLFHHQYFLTLLLCSPAEV